MSAELLEKIKLEKIAQEMEQYENQWIVISSENKIVGNGTTYEEALRSAAGRKDVVLFKVPPLDASLAL